MEVNYGGRRMSTPEFRVGDATANCPPKILSFQAPDSLQSNAENYCCKAYNIHLFNSPTHAIASKN